MVLNSAFNNEPDSWKCWYEGGGAKTLRVTHAIISSEIELLLIPNENSLHAASETMLSIKIKARIEFRSQKDT